VSLRMLPYTRVIPTVYVSCVIDQSRVVLSSTMDLKQMHTYILKYSFLSLYKN
jgi:hypothetical protein